MTFRAMLFYLLFVQQRYGMIVAAICARLTESEWHMTFGDHMIACYAVPDLTVLRLHAAYSLQRHCG